MRATLRVSLVRFISSGIVLAGLSACGNGTPTSVDFPFAGCHVGCNPDVQNFCAPGTTCQTDGKGGYWCAGGADCAEAASGPQVACHASCDPAQVNACAPGLSCQPDNQNGYWCAGSSDCPAAFPVGSCNTPCSLNVPGFCGPGLTCQGNSTVGYTCFGASCGVAADKCFTPCEPGTADANKGCANPDPSKPYAWSCVGSGSYVCFDASVCTSCGSYCSDDSMCAALGAGAACVNNKCTANQCQQGPKPPSGGSPPPPPPPLPTKSATRPPTEVPAPTAGPTAIPTLVGADGSLCGDGICQPGESAKWCGDCVKPGGSKSGGGGGGQVDCSKLKSCTCTAQDSHGSPACAENHNCSCKP